MRFSNQSWPDASWPSKNPTTKITSSMVLPQGKEPPEVAKSHTEAHTGEQIPGFVVPFFILLHLLHVLQRMYRFYMKYSLNRPKGQTGLL